MTVPSESSPQREPQQRRSRDRQGAMADAAGRLLIEEGFEAITHRRVADAAGVPQGSASYYFPSRAALVAASVRAAEGLRAASAETFARSLEPGRRSSPEAAELVIRTLFAPRVDDRVVATRLDPMLTALRDPALRPLMAEHRPRLLRSVRRTLEASGYATVTDVDLVAHLVDASLLTAAATGEEQVIRRAAAVLARYLDAVG
ncbi:TetR/AcrR family transcriptional regulator [Paraoerskovia marina]|uniref:TetR/AcrR family transcriptional regulator n=1 Tax=Paraoerskovia marina TaxID=545619 RepID=UPI000492DD85|nr:TetR family transcriptional regulator [Paraoerskovia marina]